MSKKIFKIQGLLLTLDKLVKLVLASTSRYRAALLERLLLPFDQLSPGVDETPLNNETPQALAARLSEAKARAGLALRPEAAIIGSDQVASVLGQVLGKPGNFDTACSQLARCSNQTAHFYTGLCVITPDGSANTTVVDTKVTFRELSQAEIERYLQLEEPYDCAGSFKCESLGISLFKSLQSDDPTALEGLPLIALTGILRGIGLDPLA